MLSTRTKTIYHQLYWHKSTHLLRKNRYVWSHRLETEHGVLREKLREGRVTLRQRHVDARRMRRRATSRSRYATSLASRGYVVDQRHCHATVTQSKLNLKFLTSGLQPLSSKRLFFGMTHPRAATKMLCVHNRLRTHAS